uniref:FAD/NAD(P)-binding domain-containing protein n=1 Tax=Amazona collaria TaxID=241587 RepID=A0A8B9G249_9PSIT
MEAAAFLSDKAAAISVVEKQEFPFQRVLGPQVGAVTMKMLQNKGVKFYMQAELRELQGKDGKVTEAVLASGEKLPADVVVVGIGTFPSSAFLKGTSIARDASGAILVDLHMQTNIPNVFAAGDVASFPVALLNGERCSIHHQQVAEVHGHTAALNMLKKEKQLHTIPFFWTTMFGKSIRYAGRGAAAALGYVHWRDPRSAFSFREGVVSAAASLSCDPMVALIAEALYTGKQISKEEAE